MQNYPEAAVLLGDSAYNRSKVKKDLGLIHPVPLGKNGKSAEPKVNFTGQVTVPGPKLK